MKNHIHLLGGSGKIGTSFCESLKNKKLDGIDNVWVYCDGSKTSNRIDLIPNNNNEITIIYKNYASFNLDRLVNEKFLDKKSSNIIINLRGVNNKRDWLNKPLEALDIQLQSCLNIIDSDFNLFPNTKIIHISSQLCELIEGNHSLPEICDGEDSYRHAYMISRLHQESILKAYAYKYGIETRFIRLPAVYGYFDDYNSPWILNTLIKQFSREGSITLRKPGTTTWLTHKNILVDFLRNAVLDFSKNSFESNVSYLECPKIGLKLETLSKIIEKCIIDKCVEEIDLENEILLSSTCSKEELKLQINYLKKSIIHLYDHANH